MSPSIRKKIEWENIRGPKALTALAVGTSMGAGLFPFAPGTMGTLAALPLAYFTADANWLVRVLLWSALLAAGTWAAKALDEIVGTSDNPSIVIDEVVGFGITAWTAGTNPKTLIAAFVLFRIFDILKPPPVRQLDQWSKIKAADKNKRSSRWWGGFGVMADDVLAGFQALIVILLLQHFQILP